MPSSWQQNNCLYYCESCWKESQCADCNHHDPKGVIFKGRWNCRACRHKRQVHAASFTNADCYKAIVDDQNGELPDASQQGPTLGLASNLVLCSNDLADVDAAAEAAEGVDSVAPLPAQGIRVSNRNFPLVGSEGTSAAEKRHIVLLLDSSGSMRTEDVKVSGGESIGRLEAAVQCVARFAEAHSHGRPQDVYSLLTFDEEVEMLADTLDAQGLAKAVEASCVHGSRGTFYSPALARAGKLLEVLDYAQSPEEGIGSGHVVMLSDGRPADIKDTLDLFQSRWLKNKYLKHVRIHGIGFGGTVESFAALQQLACISGGTFSLSGCSVRSLYAAFSSVSTIITASSNAKCTEVLPRRIPRTVQYEVPELGVFGKKAVLRFRASRTTFRYDGETFQEQSWPAADVMRRQRPYMCGGMRLVYGFRDAQVDSSENSWMVAKNSRYLDDALNSKTTVEAHAKSTAVARFFAARFNDFLRKSAGSASLPSAENITLPNLFLVPCFVYGLDPTSSSPDVDLPAWFSAERYLPGAFIKYNSNNGYVAEASSLRHSEFVQAFLHFSLEASGRKLLVADLQGVARDSEVLLTDPQVLSLGRDFGPGDLGPGGMRACLASHRCGPICRQLGLKPVSAHLLKCLTALSSARTAKPSTGSAMSAASGQSWAHVDPSGIHAAVDWERLSNCELNEFALSDGRSSQASASSWVHLLDT